MGKDSNRIALDQQEKKNEVRVKTLLNKDLSFGAVSRSMDDSTEHKKNQIKSLENTREPWAKIEQPTDLWMNKCTPQSRLRVYTPKIQNRRTKKWLLFFIADQMAG